MREPWEMSCLNIEQLETETGGKFTGLFPDPNVDMKAVFGASWSWGGRFVTHTFDRTRHGTKTFADYNCDTAKSVVVSMSVTIDVWPPETRPQVARMEIESAKRAGYKLCREFEDIGGDPPESPLAEVLYRKNTVVLRKGSREYVVEWITAGNGSPLRVAVGPEAYMTAHCTY